MRRLLATGLACFVAMLVLVAQTPLTPIGQLKGRTDSNGFLMVTASAAGAQFTPLTPIANLRGKTDSSGNLMVAMASGTATPDKLCLDSTNQDACLQRNGAGILQLGNAATSTDFARLQFGGSTSSFPAWKRNGNQLQAVLGDDSAFTTVSALAFAINSSGTYGVVTTLISRSAPSSPSSCGTSPAVTSNNGTASFVVTGGTGGAATGCTITMPAATTGWNCSITNITQTAAHRADRTTVQTASTTTSVTWEYQTVSTGAATAFTASDVFRGICFAF